jgi:phage minor structural protein
MPLNAAYADEIVQEANSTYQLTFRFPTSDSLWEQLKEETFLKADDLHGEQDFVIFEVEKKHGYIQVYANQIFTLLNNYMVNPISLDRQTGSTALSRFAGAITRDNPFSFFSDIEDRHTFNIGSKNAMEAFAKDKHSILGQWGGDLVRHGYQVRLLKNGGSENESLFMYKKNLSSYQHKTSTKSLKTRITFTTTVKGEGEKAPDRTFTVTIDSPLINKYSQIYEDVIEVNDQDVKDEASLRKYGEQYFRTTLCDMMEDSLELEVVGQSDVPVQMSDIVSLFHDVYNLDVRKKITKYTYSPMANKLLSIGFGQFKSGLSNMVSNAVSDAVKNEAQQLQDDFERQLARELKNADLAFDRQKEELVNQFTDGLNAAKAKAEEVKRQLSDTIDQRFSSFNNGPLQEVKRRAEEALRNSGASSLLAQEAKQIGEQARADITNLQASSQNALNQIESFKTQYGTKLNEVKSTADGLLTKMGAVETYISKDGQRQESLQRYVRDESAKQVSAVREQISRDYVGKATYQEDVRAIERRFEAITNPQNGSIATQIANYKTAVDGRFADITSMISGKANQTDFQRVQETSQLYERILGNSENGIADKVARMALTNQLFQVEVAKNVGDIRNYVKNADFRESSKSWKESNISGLNFNYEHSLKNRGKTGIHIYGSAGTTEFYGIHQTFKFEGSKNDNVILSFLASKDGANDFSGIKIGVHCRKNNAIISQMWRTIQNSEITGFSYKKIILTFNLPVDIDEVTLMFYGEPKKTINIYISEIKFEKGSNATSFTLAPEDTDEAIRSVQSQLTGSWAVQNLTSAGSIISQINATNNQILIEAEKIRLKGKTLADQFTAIDGYFKRLFVGEGAFATLNTDILRANSITADKLVMDMAMARRFVSSDIFTDTLAAKEAFINKLRSVVVTATLLEGYKGRIGGFQIGTHEKDSSVYWITGQNQFSVGMSNGSGQWSQTALWVNWGNNWAYPGNYAWYVKNNGKMYCYNTAEFWNTPVIHGNLRVTGHIYYNNENSGKTGHWIHSSKYSNFEPSDNYLYMYYSGSGYDWIPMNKEISDRRYKHNIEDSTVSGLDVIQKLKTYSYRKEYDGKIEDIACGIMAQDVQKHAPEAFFENPDGAYSYNTFALVPYLIKAIQELNQKIEKLEKTA